MRSFQTGFNSAFSRLGYKEEERGETDVQVGVNVRDHPELYTFSTYEIMSSNLLTPSPSAYEMYIFHGGAIYCNQLGGVSFIGSQYG